MLRAFLASARTAEVRIVAVSFLVLYLELALIRWVSGYIHNFGYFTNFAMLASFLGIGAAPARAPRVAAAATSVGAGPARRGRAAVERAD